MNLKESFRYQKFLDFMMQEAVDSLTNPDHCLIVTKQHHRKKSNPDAEDFVETIETESFFANDAVLSFMQWLVTEKTALSIAIEKAKTNAGISLDASIEANKFKQRVCAAIKYMLRHMPKKTIEQGRDYKFNVEGNQTLYYYDVEVESKEAYDKVNAKEIMRQMITSADTTSNEIDAVLINTIVDYTPKFDVNESFEDVMESFISH